MKTNVWAVMAAFVVGMALQSSATILWESDFEEATLNDTSTAILTGTNVKMGNTASCTVVDATTDPDAATAFTLGSGQFIRLSVGNNDYAAVLPALTLSFDAVHTTDILSMKADIYLPEASALPVFTFAPRLESTGAAGNGATFSSEATGIAGQYTITYTGSVADFVNPSSDMDAITTALPFLYIEQKVGGADGTTTDFMYMDNIKMEVIPEPAAIGMLGLGGLVILVSRRMRM